MRRILVCVVVAAACEKAGTGAIGSSPGSSAPPGPSVIVKPSQGLVASVVADAGTPIVVDAGPPVIGDAGKLAVLDAGAKQPRVAVQDRAMQAEAERIAAILTTDDSPSSSVDRDHRRPGADLDAQLRGGASIGGSSVQVGGGGGRRVRADFGDTVGGGAPGAGKGPSGRVTVTETTAHDQTTLEAPIVTSKILRAYMPGIRRCYHRELSLDPGAKGRTRTTFTVNELGGTVAARAKGFSKELDLCLEGMMPNWRFPIPKDADGEPTDASFSITLELVPS